MFYEDSFPGNGILLAAHRAQQDRGTMGGSRLHRWHSNLRPTAAVRWHSEWLWRLGLVMGLLCMV